MQEDQTITFQPIFVEDPMPWHTRLVTLYLVVMMGSLAIWLVKFALDMRKLRKMEGNLKAEFWTSCYESTNSLKNFAFLTFLISLLDFVWSAIHIFAALEFEKVSQWKFVVERIALALTPFSLGIIVCIALFSCAMAMQHQLKRRRIALGLKATADPSLRSG